MPRRVQDIVPADRRSIRNVPRDADEDKPSSVQKDIAPAPKRRSRAHEARSGEIPINRIAETARRMPITPPTPHTNQNKKKKHIWLLIALGAIIVIVIAGYIASTHFARASFTIVPKTVPITVNGTYVAQPSPNSTALTYDVITLSAISSSTVPAVDGPMTSAKSFGSVTLYNAYSAQSVKLIAGTRLSDATGRIYRLSSTVIIPGYTGPAANIIPGHIIATIVADQAGQNYNIGATDAVSDFKIVAYAGSPKYDSIYARVASALTGGFVGIKKTVNPTLVASTTAIIDAKLVASLVDRIKSSVPTGYIMYDGSYASALASPVIGGSTGGSAVITAQATVYGFIFKKADLVNVFSGSKTSTLFGDFAYSAPGLDNLQFTITNLKDYSPSKKSALIVKAKGDIKLVGTIPVSDIKKKLAGVPLTATQDVLRSFSPVVESGTGELVPPWAKVPSDLSRISVTVQN